MPLDERFVRVCRDHRHQLAADVVREHGNSRETLVCPSGHVVREWAVVDLDRAGIVVAFATFDGGWLLPTSDTESLPDARGRHRGHQPLT